MLYGNNGLTITIHEMLMNFQVTITKITPRGSLQIILSTLGGWDMLSMNTKSQNNFLVGNSCSIGSIHTTELCHLYTAILFIHRRGTFLMNLIV